MQLERRIRDLETSAPQGDPRAALIGAPPIPFNYDTRDLAFEADGFDLEQIEPPETLPPRKPGVVVPLDWDEIRMRLEKEGALREKLKSRERAEQEELARCEGYRVIYPPEDWRPQPRIRARLA